MKELKIEETTKIKVEPGVQLTIVGAKQSNLVIDSAEYLNIDMKKVSNANITMQSCEHDNVVLSDSKGVDIAAYNSELRLARN